MMLNSYFASFKYKNNPLKDAIESGLQPEAERLGVELRAGPFVNPLEELIHQAYKKYQRKGCSTYLVEKW